MNNINIQLSDMNKGRFGIVGHVGVGHVHSHSSFVQDDSAGFAVVASMMNMALKAETSLVYIKGNPSTGEIIVRTSGGGVGKTFARRGITPYEAELMQRVLEHDGIYTQKLAVKAFGRMYGQGVTETPVAFQGAIALAVLDTFKKKAPDKVITTNKKYLNQIDKMAGLVIEIDGIPVSLLLNINGTDGGIGPNEDNEGNVQRGVKGNLMEAIGLNEIPTIVVESKAYIPEMAKDLTNLTYFIRAQEGIDNSAVAEALINACKSYNISYEYSDDNLPMVENKLKKATIEYSEKIIHLGKQLKTCDTSAAKVQLIAELAKLVSEDAGGISFMSNSLHDKVRSAGMEPGYSAVLSLLVTKQYCDHWKIPLVDPFDIEQYKKIVFKAIKNLETLEDEAYLEISKKRVT